MESQSFRLDEYWGALRRHWFVVVIATVVGLVVGIAASLLLPKTYVAVSTVAVNPTLADAGQLVGGRTTSQINLDTEAQIAESAEVLSRIAEAENVDAVTLAKRVEIAVPANTTILRISFSASSAEEAQQLSADVAQAYLANRGEVAQALVNAKAERLRESINSINAQIAKASSTGARENLQEARAQLAGQIAVIEAEAIDPGRVLTTARVPESADSPRPLVVLLSGTALGFLVGLLLAFVRDRRRGVVYSGGDVERIAGVGFFEGAAAGAGGSTASIVSTVAARPDPQVLGVIAVDDDAAAWETAESLAAKLSAMGRPATALAPWAEVGPFDSDGVMQALAMGTLRGLFQDALGPRTALVALPTILAKPEVVAVAASVDADILVVRLGETPRDQLQEVVTTLGSAGAAVLGVVSDHRADVAGERQAAGLPG